MAADDFTHTAPHAIAHHRAAQPFLDAETEAAQRPLVGAKKRGKVRIRAALPGVVDGVEFALAQQSRFSWKAKTLLRRIHRQRSLLLGGRKAMTPLLAARGKHPAATLGLHAHAKSVRFCAASFPRLICTLWQSNPPVSSYFVSSYLISVQFDSIQARAVLSDPKLLCALCVLPSVNSVLKVPVSFLLSRRVTDLHSTALGQLHAASSLQVPSWLLGFAS
jgi:hypothetical protein